MNKSLNINVELFRKTAPKSKVELVHNMSSDDILKLSSVSVIRMVKETGDGVPRSRNKRLFIDFNRRAGNKWNSTVEGVEIYKNTLLVNVYVQYSNSDTTQVLTYNEFFGRKSYRGEIDYYDRYGNTQTAYYSYDAENLAMVLRSVCLEYLYRKYADKL